MTVDEDLVIGAIALITILAYFVIGGLTHAIARRVVPHGNDVIQGFVSAFWPIALPVWLLATVLDCSLQLGIWLGTPRERKAKLPKAQMRR